MAASLIILALSVASAVAAGVPAARYPVGVDPHLCPNYPYCNDVALAVVNYSASTRQAAPAYTANGHYDTAVQGAGERYPAGVDPHHCPKYPYCGPTTVHGVLGYTGAHGESNASVGLAGAHASPVWIHGALAARQGAGAHPAGVDPHACPNYPFCHH